MSLTLVRFTVGRHQCALAVDDVEEVLRIVAVTPLPAAPAFVEGVVNRRGTVMPILDLRKRVGVPAGRFDSNTRILVTSLRGHRAGLIVDEVSDVVEVGAAGMGLDPTESLGIDLRQYSSRVVRDGDALVMVIDPDRILASDEARQLDAAVAAEQGDGEAQAS